VSRTNSPYAASVEAVMADVTAVATLYSAARDLRAIGSTGAAGMLEVIGSAITTGPTHLGWDFVTDQITAVKRALGTRSPVEPSVALSTKLLDDSRRAAEEAEQAHSHMLCLRSGGTA